MSGLSKELGKISTEIWNEYSPVEFGESMYKAGVAVSLCMIRQFVQQYKNKDNIPKKDILEVIEIMANDNQGDISRFYERLSNASDDTNNIEKEVLI